MMDYEKAYKAVLQTATQWIKDGCTDRERICLECVFPELRESEDERINKAIFKALSKKDARDVLLAEGVQVSEALAYLEKQKEQKPAVNDTLGYDLGYEKGMDAGIEYVLNHLEQYGLCKKPAEWSDKDKNIFKLALDLIKDSDDCDGILDKELAVKWFAELPSRFVPQPKQEWSEEDKQWLESIIREYEERLSGDKDHAAVIQVKINLLKSLRPSWKPSEEQMRALGDYIDGEEISEYDMEEIVRLYNDLKKLCQ